MKGTMKHISAVFLAVLISIVCVIPAFAAANTDAYPALTSALSNIPTPQSNWSTSQVSDYESIYTEFSNVQNVNSNLGYTYSVAFTAVGSVPGGTVTRCIPYSDLDTGSYSTLASDIAGFNTSIGSSTSRTKDSKTAGQELQKAIDTMDTGANITEAVSSLEGIKDLFKLVTGIVVVVLTLAMGLFTAVDVAYLVFPIAHEKMDNTAQQGGRMSKENKQTGESQFRLVTDDAQAAWRESSETGGNAIVIYLKKRIISYIAVAIVLYMLLSGNLGLIIEKILNMLSTAFNAIDNATN